ncbi:MAG: GTPase HflX [Mariprofundaceae bacterium]
MKPPMQSTGRKPDAVISLHPELANKRMSSMAWQARAEEFDRLVLASDCELLSSICMPIRRPVAGTLFGRGQIDEVGSSVDEAGADVVFVDHPLTPVQQRNLERAWQAKVVDRTGLILEIFAARARTREGALQVELASLNYQISRLVRSWTHLERQRGGFGFLGGPGERQIELDRRMIRGRIRQIEKDLARVRRMRATQRAGRKRKDIPTVALVGYTNAGKSTLFNRLTASRVYVADQLFATLDPTLRLLELEGGGRLVLSDTVGFVQDLPHELVDAFRATLEEVVEADLILHVRDAADAQVAEQGKVVSDALAQLGLAGDHAPPIVEVWNKVDLAPQVQSRLAPGIAGSRVAVSALSGLGLDVLRSMLQTWLEKSLCELHLRLAVEDGRGLAFCHERGYVLLLESRPDCVEIVVRMHERDAARFKPKGRLHQLDE